MRELKFRAWDKEDKKMKYGIEREYDFMLGHGDCFGEFLECPEWYVVMQYTGFKDKNGKEIYEGDVYKQDAYTGRIFWSGDFWATESGNYDDAGLAGDYNYIEVIGNIYENPELLKDKK